MTKKLTTIHIAIGSILLFVLCISIGLHTNAIKLPIVKEIHPKWVADFTDDKILVGTSHNIFVGKVIRQSGTFSTIDVPYTQFEVAVIRNVKGSLQNTVTINQLGGYKNGVLHVVHNGDILSPADGNTEGLLEPGETYLLSTRYYEDKDWHTLMSHPNGKKVLSQDAGSSLENLKGIANNDERVAQLKKAYKNEVLLKVDVAKGNARNSFKSLQASK